MKNKLFEIIGWYGMLAIVVSYALVSNDIIDAQSLIYQILNGTGALGVLVISFIKKAYQPAVLNIVWFIIAIVAIFKIIT